MSLTMPPAGQLITASGVTYWVSQDQNGTQVVPMGNYGWTGLLWLPIGVDSNNNQLVNVNAALPAGTNPIGEVTLGAGTNAVGEVTLGAGTNAVGSVILGAALPSGTNPLGTVALTGTLAPLPPTVVTNISIPTAAAAGDQVSIDLSSVWIPARSRAFYIRDVSGSATNWQLLVSADAATVASWGTNGDANNWISPTAHPSLNDPVTPTMQGLALVIEPASTVTANGSLYEVVLYQQP